MMNRAKTESSARDQVRVKPGEKPVAASAKPPHDDAKLLTLLQSAKRELQGLRLVHLHLSLLKEKSHSDIAAIRRAVQEISENSAFLQMFGLSNEPALLLGTDLLESFRRISLDFRARKVRFQLRRCKPQGILVTTSPETFTRISATAPDACAR